MLVGLDDGAEVGWLDPLPDDSFDRTVDGGLRLLGFAQPLSHFLAFSAVGNPKLLDTTVVWAPAGLPPRELTAVARPRSFRVAHNLDSVNRAAVAVEALGAVADAAPELVGTSTVWRSTTPFAPTRNGRGEPQVLIANNVQCELIYRGIEGELVSVEFARGDWLSFRRP